MGRRAADPTTPVPVLGVPALVGVRGWRALTWTHQCNVGVQTSPAIRPTLRSYQSQSETQQADTVTIQSEKKVSIPPNGHISNDSGTEDDAKKDRKRSIFVKQRSLETKTKKGVTFQGLDVELPEDASKGVKSEVHTRTIKTNPRLHGGMANGRAKGRRDVRFTNGSVVDSEAIGGISSDISEGEEPTQGLETAVHSGKRKVPSSSPPHRPPLRICSTCGGRQNPVATVVYTTTRGATSPTSTGSDTLSSSPATPFYPGKEMGGPFSPVSVQAEKYTTYKSMQMDKGSAAMRPPPYPNININSDLPLSSTQEKEVSKLTRHSFTRKYMGAALPQTNKDMPDSPVTSTSCPCAHSVTVIQEVGTQTHSSLCPTSQKPVSLSYRAEETRAPMLTLPTNAHKHSIVATHAKTHGPSGTSTHAKTPHKPHCNGMQPKLASVEATLTHSKPLTLVHPHRNSDMNSLPTDSHPKTCESITTAATVQPTTPKSTPQTHGITHPKGPSLTAQSNHATTHPKSSASLHSPRSAEDQSLEPSHLNAAFKPFSTSHPNTDVKLPNGLEARQNTHPRPSVSSDANPSAKPQSVSQIHFCTDPKPPATSNSNYSKACGTSTYTQTYSVTGNTCLHMDIQTLRCSSHTSTHSKPPSTIANTDMSVSAQCTLPQVDTLLKPHSILKNQSGSHCKLSRTSYTAIHPSTACNPCSVTTMSLLTRTSTAETTQAFVEVHSNSVEQPKTSPNGLAEAVQEANAVSITEKPGNRIGESSTAATSSVKFSSKAVAEPVANVKTSHKFPTEAETGIHNIHADCELFATSESQTAHQQFSPQPSVPPRIPNTFCPHAYRPPKPSHAPPLHPAFELLIEVTRNRGANADSKPNPHLPSSHTLSGTQIQNHNNLKCTEPHKGLETDSQASIMLPISGAISNGRCTLTHYHPPSLALLLPTSLECGRNQDPQKRLEKVEASLQANQERITTLLNIIQDLEMSHALSKGRRCFRTGQDLSECSTCQETACIIYSVEYDFRKQERRFREVLEPLDSPVREMQDGGHHIFLSFPTSQNHSEASSLPSVYTEPKAKAKIKTKKLCRKFFGWLPRKVHRK
ncbi:mucin-12 [Pygocentrus nattereri]|uniref:Uncharacterized protein n=1 Tax=Pygocentrus nattereri TaxID=42514 RepID=A0A3B4EHW3_PYGNA|nr:mucin-12 [Pygocentrus nattereri]